MTEFELHHGDCVEGMSRLKEVSVDLIVTSPPYNLGIAYGQYSDREERGSYLDWCETWGAAAKRVLKPDGSLFLNVGAAPSNPLLPHELLLRFRTLFVLQNTIHWIKAISIEDEVGELTSRGHFKPINSARYLNDCHEYVFHLTPHGRTPIDRLALGVRTRIRVTSRAGGTRKGTTFGAAGTPCSVPYPDDQEPGQQRPHRRPFPVSSR
jgi:site-specific DNA-methyltransferase (adenine-specific)